MRFIDTHCHLNNKLYAEDKDEVLTRAAGAGVDRLLVISWDLASSQDAFDLAVGTSPGAQMYAAIGIHPDSADEWGEDARRRLTSLYNSGPGRVVAYGEIGLDYYRDSVPHEKQQTVFAEQIVFAESLRPNAPLAIVIHCRESLDDILAVIRESRTKCPVIMHCFTGDVDAARKCLDLGCYLGIGGVATYKKSDDVRTAVAHTPLDRIVLETDCPYLAPQTRRGKRNEPSFLPWIAETVAAVKRISVEEVASATTANAEKLLRLTQV